MDKKHKKLLKFTDWVIGRLGIKNKPQIRFSDDKSEVTKHRTFGSTTPNNTIWVHVGDRNTADVMRTLCHELVHAKQFEIGTAKPKMDPKREQGIEDEANAMAGRMMRKYGKMDATIYESVERACCAELRRGLLKLEKTDYDTIDRLMKQIAKKHNITPKQLHDYFVETHGIIPDTWIKKQKKLRESREGSLTHEVADSLPHAYVLPDINSGNPYLQYKFGVAIAAARGAQARKDDHINPFDENGMLDVFSDQEFVVSFDPHIDQIISAALKKIGMPDNKKIVGVKGSRESSDVAKVSPVIGFKGF